MFGRTCIKVSAELCESVRECFPAITAPFQGSDLMPHCASTMAINSTPCVSRLKSNRTAPQVSLNVRFTILNTKQTRLSALAFQHRPRNIVRSTVAKDTFIPNEDCCHCPQFVQANDVMPEPFETVLLMRIVLR